MASRPSSCHRAAPGSAATLVRPAKTLARESLIGRKYDIVHYYKDWNDSFPTPDEATLAGGGRFLFYNVINRDFSGGGVCWGAIANGSQDDVIDAKAARLKAFGKPVFFSFAGEPESRLGTCNASTGKWGSASDFAAAWRHLHTRFVADGATNVVWVWDVMGYSGNYSLYPTLWPGDSYVDWVGWDPYNWYTCHNSSWKDFSATASSFYTWLGQNSSPGHAYNSKPYMLAEYGTREDPASNTRKDYWFRNEPFQIKNFVNLRAVVQAPPITLA